MKREQWIGLVVVLVLVGGLLWWRAAKRAERPEVFPAEGEGVEIEDRASQLAKRLGVVLPETGERTSLKDVTGGLGEGIATQSFEKNQFEQTILAMLPEPPVGSWYEGWLVRDEPFSSIYTGKLRLAKGGYLLEFSSSQDLRDHRKVVVTVEKKDDKKPETHALEGEFK